MTWPPRWSRSCEPRSERGERAYRTGRSKRRFVEKENLAGPPGLTGSFVDQSIAVVGRLGQRLVQEQEHRIGCVSPVREVSLGRRDGVGHRHGEVLVVATIPVEMGAVLAER